MARETDSDRIGARPVRVGGSPRRHLADREGRAVALPAARQGAMELIGALIDAARSAMPGPR